MYVTFLCPRRWPHAISSWRSGPVFQRPHFAPVSKPMADGDSGPWSSRHYRGFLGMGISTSLNGMTMPSSDSLMV